MVEAEGHEPAATSKGDEAGFSAAAVRRIIRAAVPDVKAVAADAVLVMAKAAEEFLAALTEQAAVHVVEEKRKILLYKDVALAVERVQCLDFLADVVPQKVTAAKYLQMVLQQQQQQQQGQQQEQQTEDRGAEATLEGQRQEAA